MARKLVPASPKEIKAALIYILIPTAISQTLFSSSPIANFGCSEILHKLEDFWGIKMERDKLIELLKAIVEQINQNNPNFTLAVFAETEEIRIDVCLTLTPENFDIIESCVTESVQE